MSDIGKCVVCGRNYLCGNHQCPPRVLKAKDAAVKQEPSTEREPTDEQRLKLGFFMLSLSEA